MCPAPRPLYEKAPIAPVWENVMNTVAKVTWSNEGALPFGPARLFAVFADRLIGPDYEKGLARQGAVLARTR